MEKNLRVWLCLLNWKRLSLWGELNKRRTGEQGYVPLSNNLQPFNYPLYRPVPCPIKYRRPATERFPTADLLVGLFKRILCYHVIYNLLALFVAAVHRSKGYQTADNHCLHSIALRYCWGCDTSTKRTGRTECPKWRLPPPVALAELLPKLR